MACLDHHPEHHGSFSVDSGSHWKSLLVEVKPSCTCFSNSIGLHIRKLTRNRKPCLLLLRRSRSSSRSRPRSRRSRSPLRSRSSSSLSRRSRRSSSSRSRRRSSSRGRREPLRPPLSRCRSLSFSSFRHNSLISGHSRGFQQPWHDSLSAALSSPSDRALMIFSYSILICWAFRNGTSHTQNHV